MKLRELKLIVAILSALLCLTSLRAGRCAPHTALRAENPTEVGGRWTQGMKIRDRIKELRRVRASELLPNPRNWRVHPKAQVQALRALLSEVGYADALIARELPDGRLQLIDGHLRAETTPDDIVPVLVLDVTE